MSTAWLGRGFVILKQWKTQLKAYVRVQIISLSSILGDTTDQ